MKHAVLIVLIISSFLAIGIAYDCTRPQKSEPQTAGALPVDHQFVGDQTCASCHSEQAKAWHGSDHDQAMKKATENTVRGNFDNVTFSHNGDRYRFFRDGDRFMVHAPGPDENMQDYEITYTFGWEPLQQYLIDYGKGKYQVLRVSWDTQKQQWYYMDPGSESNRTTLSDKWMHWTGGAMNWNTMCSNCHSTNVSENYVASADSFHTTWSSINVSCEACHGPGKKHVDFMKSEEAAQATIERIRRDLRLTKNVSQQEQITQCAQCHSLREGLTDDYNHEGDYLDHFNPSLPHPPAYFADGQIKGEDYVYGSFLQSKMFKNKVKCNDCHDPHSLHLKANVTDNSLCLQCHDTHYNSPDHYHHKPNTKASQCINCHMPGRYYMEIDFRRDHSFRVPRPDLSQKFGNPNACSNCHDDKTAKWATQAIDKWYGNKRAYHFSETFLKADSLGKEAAPDLKQLFADTSTNNIVRATALWYLGQFPNSQSADLLKKALHDSSGLVRNSAVRALSSLGQNIQNKPTVLAAALDDSLRSVRLGAVQGLAEFTAGDMPFDAKKSFNKAIKEYKNYLYVNQYFPQGAMNKAQFYEKQGKTSKAIAFYKKTLARDPYFNQARINLAYLYNQQGNNREAEKLLRTVIEQQPEFGPPYYSLALLLAEEQRLQEAIPNLKKASELMPQNDRVFYNLAISYQRDHQPEASEQAYQHAIELAPQNPTYLYGITTLYLQQKQYQKAKIYAQRLLKIQPNNNRVQRLLGEIDRRMKNATN